jgi:hypothetical protein
MSHGQAGVLVAGGVLVLILGVLQGVTGRSTMSSRSLGGPASRRTGWIMAAIGVVAAVVGVVVLSRTA